MLLTRAPLVKGGAVKELAVAAAACDHLLLYLLNRLDRRS